MGKATPLEMLNCLIWVMTALYSIRTARTTSRAYRRARSADLAEAWIAKTNLRAQWIRVALCLLAASSWAILLFFPTPSPVWVRYVYQTSTAVFAAGFLLLSVLLSHSTDKLFRQGGLGREDGTR